jgi:hypothetical protein
MGPQPSGQGWWKGKFCVGEVTTKAFDDMKHFLCSTPILSLPDFQQTFEIEIDASNYVMGTVLTEHGHPMAYDSETLSYVICKYPTYGK